MRREVLGSVEGKAAARLVFSGLIPIHKQQQSSDGPKKPRFSVIRYAEELGAIVQPNVNRKTTTSHVVAARDGTDKIKQARQTKGCNVVKMSGRTRQSSENMRRLTSARKPLPSL
eukprot:scaffold22035_cov57-Attheya_sp.AAC.1